MRNAHPNAFGPARPLTAARIRELLDALRESGGDHTAFGRASRGAQAEDFERLAWLWRLTEECWSGADGRDCARRQIDAELAATREPGGQGLWSMFQNAMDAQARQLESVTDQELDALTALALELRDALDPSRSALMREMQAIVSAPRSDPTVIRPEDPEAREWLAGNGHPMPLAANRFGEKEDAQAFVEELYAAGAVRVVIAAECIRDDEDELAHGGPYADGLRVQLPSAPGPRAAVLALVNAEEEEEGFDPSEDEGQDVVFLWWD